MKKIVSALAVLAVVGSTLAFKPFGSGSVFCTSSCATRINFKVDPAGTFTNPCDNGDHQFVLTADNTCVQVASGSHYSSTAPGK